MAQLLRFLTKNMHLAQNLRELCKNHATRPVKMLSETVILANFGQILVMKPPIS